MSVRGRREGAVVTERCCVGAGASWLGRVGLGPRASGWRVVRFLTGLRCLAGLGAVALVVLGSRFRASMSVAVVSQLSESCALSP